MIEFTILLQDLPYYNEAAKMWIADKGKYEIMEENSKAGIALIYGTYRITPVTHP